MKNCNSTFHLAVAQKGRMKTMASLCESTSTVRTVKDKAMTLVNQWGREVKGKDERLKLFLQTYQELRRKGLMFPKAANDSPMFVEKPDARTRSAQRVATTRTRRTTNDSPASMRTTSHDPSIYVPKLKKDLDAVDVRVILCKDMIDAMKLKSRPSKTLVDNLDFIDQCVPRLENVINASISGNIDLPEEIVGRLIGLNDTVRCTLNRFIAFESSGYTTKPPSEQSSSSSSSTTTTTASAVDPISSDDVSTKDEDVPSLAPPLSGTRSLLKQDDLEDLFAPTAAPTVGNSTSDEGNVLEGLFDESTNETAA